MSVVYFWTGAENEHMGKVTVPALVCLDSSCISSASQIGACLASMKRSDSRSPRSAGFSMQNSEPARKAA